jgi:hypothetical protein
VLPDHRLPGLLRQLIVVPAVAAGKELRQFDTEDTPAAIAARGPTRNTFWRRIKFFAR